MAQTIQKDVFLNKLKCGDNLAFTELFNTHKSKVYNRANSLLNNHQDAEEVMQDTFIKARNNITKFRGDCSISTWLYHIATNLAHNKHWYWFRRKRKESISLHSNIDNNDNLCYEDILACEAQTPSQECASSEIMNIIPKVINNLDENYASILKLRYEQDLNYEEISKVLKINIGTVKSRLSRARESLRENLGNYK